MESPEQKLAGLNITLPAAPAAIGAYVGWVRTGNLIAVSGQLPLKDGKIVYAGKIPGDLSEDDGCQAARLCAINGIAQLKAAAGNLDKVVRIVRLEGFVNSSPGFTAQPKIMNGASELIAAVFGERGRHSRVAVGVAELPVNAAVEISLWAEVE